MARRRSKAQERFTWTVIAVLIGLYLIIQFSDFFLTVGGVIIVLVAVYYMYRWKKRSDQRKKVLQSGIREIDVMSGEDFERYLGVLFEANGYKVEMTKASGDFGADLILKGTGKTIVVQAKRYSKTVGVNAIQEVHASKDYYRADEAWVVTNQDFSTNAYELAAKNKVKLLNRDQLINYITDTRKQIGKEQETQTSTSA